MAVFFSLLLGAVYQNQGHNQASIQNRIGLLV
jgi:hypothetical protein